MANPIREGEVNSYTAPANHGALVPFVVSLAHGRFADIWMEYPQGATAYTATSVNAQIFEANGTSVGNQLLLESTGIFGNSIDAPTRPAFLGASALSTGGFVITYVKDTVPHGSGVRDWTDVYAQRFDSDGMPVGSEIKITNSGTEIPTGPDTAVHTVYDDPQVAGTPDGGFVVSYTMRPDQGSGAVVQFAGVDAGGLVQYHGGGTLVLFPAPEIVPKGGYSNVAVSSSGTTAVTYEQFDDNASATEIYVQLASASGAAGAPIRLTAGDPQWEEHPSVAALSNGDFVVSWDDPAGDGPGDPGVRASIIHPNGTVVASDFLVSQQTAGFQGLSDVVGLSDGRFIVVWDTPDPDNANAPYEGHGRLFSASGVALGDEFRIWNGIAQDQTRPEITQIGPNQIAVTWADTHQSNVIDLQRLVLAVDTSAAPNVHANAQQYVAVHGNDLTHAGTASGNNHFIDYLNFEASFPDLIHAFGTNQQSMQSWYNTYEPQEHRVETFDGLDYIASYSDLIHAFASAGSMKAVQDDGASHFISSGLAEGRSTTFNGLDYIASYGDLINALGANSDAGAYHYIENGQNEGRTTTFDGLDYIASYTDLIHAFGANEQAGAAHYIINGAHEGRTTTFNGLDYIASYGDLIHAFGANNDAGATHYIEAGRGEGRTTTFDGLDYIASYNDLIRAFGANEQAGAAHYITNGRSEGRTTSFDGLSYIAQYTDLMSAFGANNDAGAAHYINNGFAEGRSTSFNVAAYEQAHPDLQGRFLSDDAFLAAYINNYQATGTFLT